MAKDAKTTPQPNEGKSKPKILILGQDPTLEARIEAQSVATGATILKSHDGLAGWEMLCRNEIGLIILGHFESPLTFVEVLFMIHNDNEFLKIPLIINGQDLSAEEKHYVQYTGISHWLTHSVTDAQLKEVIETTYNKPQIIVNALVENREIERKIRNLYLETNLRFKIAVDSTTFLGRLDYMNPDLIMLDLRLSADSPMNILKIIKQDQDWTKIPVICICPRDHELQKPAAFLGAEHWIHENLPKSEARRVIPIVCRKFFYDLPITKLANPKVA